MFSYLNIVKQIEDMKYKRYEIKDMKKRRKAQRPKKLYFSVKDSASVFHFFLNF